MEARLVKANADNSRAQVLRGQGIMATEEAEKMRTEAAVLEAQLDVVKVKIERTIIRAPFAGVIADRNTSLGAVVKVGQTLYKLAAAGKLASYRVLNRSVRFAKEDVLALAIPRSVRRSDRGMRQ